MPAKPLTPEQVADAKRLERLMSAYQDRLRAAGEAATQDALAELFHFGQSALNQYLKGKIPLNAEALLKFCTVLGAEPVDISPSITANQDRFVLQWLRRSTTARAQVGLPPLLTESELKLIVDYRKLPPARQQQVEILADALQPWAPAMPVVDGPASAPKKSRDRTPRTRAA